MDNCVSRAYCIRNIQFIVMCGAMVVFCMRYGALDTLLLKVLLGLLYVLHVMKLLSCYLNECNLGSAENITWLSTATTSWLS